MYRLGHTKARISSKISIQIFIYFSLTVWISIHDCEEIDLVLFCIMVLWYASESVLLIWWHPSSNMIDKKITSNQTINYSINFILLDHVDRSHSDSLSLKYLKVFDGSPPLNVLYPTLLCIKHHNHSINFMLPVIKSLLQLQWELKKTLKNVHKFVWMLLN